MRGRIEEVNMKVLRSVIITSVLFALGLPGVSL